MYGDPGREFPAGRPGDLAGHGRTTGGSIGAVVVEHHEDRLDHDPEVEEHRPVLDVEQVVFDALAQLLLSVRLAAPAVDLRPAGDARLDAVAGRVLPDQDRKSTRLNSSH